MSDHTAPLERALEILQHTFGYSDFRLNQAAIIESVLNGQDTFALLPTGGGKSLCYQIPALVRDGTGVVISPLIALMEDQVSALQQLGIKAAFLNSSLDAFEAREVEERLRNQQLDLLYISPEKMLTPRMQEQLRRSRISLFAIDEAHCVSAWGHDFRMDYRQLHCLAELFPEVPKIALTATADQRTQEDIIRQLSLRDAACYTNSFDRPNLRYMINGGENARQRLWRFLERDHPEDAGIIYCLSRKKVEDTAAWLSSKGRNALPYHAGLPVAVRSANQRRFLREEGVIIVATIAFGMGIDKPDVRFVAHLSLPKSVEAYYQETGRAGRDGQPSNVWMSYSLQDVITLRQMMSESQASEEQKRVEQQKLEALLGICESTRCRRQTLLGYFGEELSKPCGNCDNCLSPPKTRDATEDARKALSCIYRTGQRFGVNYLIDVLCGKDDERIKGNGHDQLSTYAIGKHLSHAHWRLIYRQLITQALVRVDHERHGALTLAPACRPLLKGEAHFELRLDQDIAGDHNSKKSATHVPLADTPLWDALRALRKQLAETHSVPPYAIFHDATLKDMLSIRPETQQALRYIAGVGEKKLERYGAEFLKVIKQFRRNPMYSSALSDTVNDTLFLIEKGHSPEIVAQERNIAVETVYGHCAQAIEYGVISVDDVFALDEDQVGEIMHFAELLNLEGPVKLSELYLQLDGEYDYGILKCVVAQMNAGARP